MTLKTVAVMVATLTLLAGCGGPPKKKMLTVTGTVTYKGQQLKSGVIKFLAPNGDFATATINSDGKFIMTEVVPGEQKVAYVGGPVSVGSSDTGTRGGGVGATAVAVPAKFNDPQTSGATVTVPESGGDVTVALN
ncbi:hypothetical protein [Limnoglobus roseus]|uniref:Carboxypeptidase regulatory-like domain-containing protein n=1 Tax=Limnoglobus roseus TaxID=2598579 RepID=A0A5C1A6Z9_9BACT|nr:hypothetical protein [Limnoglobus roseus]QEL13612.1 carboxypeptidase regulatory-like domain-containing protein [Limnoglobus roseus]